MLLVQRIIFTKAPFIQYEHMLLDIFIIIFYVWDEVGTKDRFFHRGWGMGMEALIRKNTRFWGSWAL